MVGLDQKPTSIKELVKLFQGIDNSQSLFFNLAIMPFSFTQCSAGEGNGMPIIFMKLQQNAA